MTLRTAINIVCVLGCVACTRSQDDSDGGAAHGGGATAGTGSVTPVKGGYCCAPSAEPNCCMLYGGFTTSRDGCGGETCDGMPSPSEDWKLETDEHGCKHWVEPREWTDCCGCLPHARLCDPTGTWRIEYVETKCGPRSEMITLTAEDGGADEVVFHNRGLRSWQCGGDATESMSVYEATATESENGCVVTLSAHSKWCLSGEGQCEDLDVKLYLNPSVSEAEVEGSARKCWCGEFNSNSMPVHVTGVALREVPS